MGAKQRIKNTLANNIGKEGSKIMYLRKTEGTNIGSESLCKLP